jgi:hypothetical protein
MSEVACSQETKRFTPLLLKDRCSGRSRGSLPLCRCHRKVKVTDRMEERAVVLTASPHYRIIFIGTLVQAAVVLLIDKVQSP